MFCQTERLGLGHVVSTASTVVQNSLICSYKYHCLSMERPLSGISSGSSAVVQDQQ